MHDKLAFPSILTPNARYLALCGDIGYPNQQIFTSFIDYCSRNWDKVFYLPGNHEYYNEDSHFRWKFSAPHTMESIEKHIIAVLSPYRNVFYLNKGIHEFPEEGVNVIGATMWTHIPKEKYMHAGDSLNDFAKIACETAAAPNYERFTPAKMEELHSIHSNFILGALKSTSAQNRRAVVLTHHMPSLALVAPRFVGDSHNYLFYTEMTRHLNHPALAAWICGHSHSARKILFRPGVWLALNCKGYPNEHPEGFSPQAFIEIPRPSESCFTLSKDDDIELL